MYTREGCRGGRENFSWNSLKEQDFKDREQYLGASAKVGLMSKFGKYYVHDWYAKERGSVANIEDERKTVQQYEEELMQEALGLKPKKLLLAKKQLSPEEIEAVLAKDSDKRMDQKGRELMGPQKKTVTDAQGQEVEADILYADNGVKGLGFAAHRNAKLEKYKADVLGTESKLEGIKSEVKLEMKKEMMTDQEVMKFGGASSSSSGSGCKKEEPKAEPELKQEDSKVDPEIKKEPGEASSPQKGSKRPAEDADVDDDKKRKKADKKAKKKEKKAEKKAKKKVKKAAKKEKKAAKLAAKVAEQISGKKSRHKSSESSSSSSS